MFHPLGPVPSIAFSWSFGSPLAAIDLNCANTHAPPQKCWEVNKESIVFSKNTILDRPQTQLLWDQSIDQMRKTHESTNVHTSWAYGEYICKEFVHKKSMHVYPWIHAKSVYACMYTQMCWCLSYFSILKS